MLQKTTYRRECINMLLNPSSSANESRSSYNKSWLPGNLSLLPKGLFRSKLPQHSQIGCFVGSDGYVEGDLDFSRMLKGVTCRGVDEQLELHKLPKKSRLSRYLQDSMPQDEIVDSGGIIKSDT